MTEKYLITFTPINRFFFGSSHSFAEGFYVVSMKYPQPPTILGCLRNTILMQNQITKTENGRVIPDIYNDKAKNLTGTAEMKRLDDTDNNFGIIERLSPVFIVKQSGDNIDDILFPVPIDIEKKNCKLSCIKYEKKNEALSNYSGITKNYAILSSRDPKEHRIEYLGGKYFWGAYINNKETYPYNSDYEEDEIFKRNISVGIKRENRQAKDEYFYTKIDFTLKKGFSFGVIVWLTENDKLKDGTVILGGEQSAFRMEIKKVEGEIFTTHPIMNEIINSDTNIDSVIPSVDDNNKFIAISPLICSKEFINNCEHARISGINAIRTYSRFSNKKSDAVCMIPAGSVLYPSSNINKLTGWKISYKIGYNSIIKIRKGF